MEALVSLFYFLCFGLVIFSFPFFRSSPGLKPRLLMLFFTLKVLSGILLILIYTFYYDLAIADFYKYYADGKIMFMALQDNPLDYLRMLSGINASLPHLEGYYNEMSHWYRPWESPVYNDNRILIRFNAFVHIFSMGYIHVHNIFINFLSVSGLVALYKFFAKHSSDDKIFWLPWGIFLFPGLLFWGSGILKEGFLIMAFGFWIYATDLIFHSRKFHVSVFIIILFCGFILTLLKPYHLLILVPCQVAFYLGLEKGIVAKQVRYFLSIGAWAILGFLAATFLFSYDLIEIVARKQNDFINYSSWVEAGSLLHTRYVKPELWDFVLFFPRAFFYVLTRPHVFEVYSPVVMMAAIENLIILIMLVYAVFFRDKHRINHPLIWLSIWFAVLIMGFVGVVTPLHGAFVRYKILALPFIWVAFIHFSKLPAADRLKNTPLFKFLQK